MSSWSGLSTFSHCHVCDTIFWSQNRSCPFARFIEFGRCMGSKWPTMVAEIPFFTSPLPVCNGYSWLHHGKAESNLPLNPPMCKGAVTGHALDKAGLWIQREACSNLRIWCHLDNQQSPVVVVVIPSQEKVKVHTSLVVLESPLVVLQMSFDFTGVHPPHLRDLVVRVLVWH